MREEIYSSQSPPEACLVLNALIAPACQEPWPSTMALFLWPEQEWCGVGSASIESGEFFDAADKLIRIASLGLSSEELSPLEEQ